MVLTGGRAAGALLAVACAACMAPPPARDAAPLGLALLAADGTPRALATIASAHRLTVLVFFSRACRCFDVHEERVRALAGRYARRDVAVVVVDSEAGATPAADAAESRRRRLPLWVDPDARIARAFGAEYGTYSVLVDAIGRVWYRGAIDSDRVRLHDDARPFLREAVDDVLAGRSPRRARTEPLGCALRLD